MVKYLSQIYRSAQWLIMIQIMSLLATSCIMEGPGSCPPSQTHLYITVGTNEGQAVTDSVREATISIFDENYNYLYSIDVSGEEIAEHKPVLIEHGQGEATPYVVIWGNQGDREVISSLIPGSHIDRLTSMQKEDSEGFVLPPDPLFYGKKKLTGNITEIVRITPKNSRITVTVKGLSSEISNEKYYFTLHTYYSGYTYSGNPIPATATIKLPGILDNEDNLVTPQACHMIHYPYLFQQNIKEMPQAVTLNLYQKKTNSDDKRLFSINKDSNGQPIIPQAGKTTNVLVHLNEEGETDVTVVITSWNEIHQWNEW